MALFAGDSAGRVISAIYGDLIPHRGLRIHTDSDRVSNSTKAMLFWNLYERSEIEQTAAYYQEGLDVIELGASIGASTTQICRYATGKVVAVEADPELVQLLQRNLITNFGRDHRCEVINAAIDYSGAETVQFVRGELSLTGQIAGKNHMQGRTSLNVVTTTLAEILERHEIVKYILVVDIEGAEVGLFLEERAAFKGCHRIVAEIDGGIHKGTMYSISDVVDLLQSSGFRLVHSHGNRKVFEKTSFLQ